MKHEEGGKEGGKVKQKTTLFMETTQVPADRTAAEITAALVAAGATSVHSRYKDGALVGLAWSIIFNGQELWFDMPARIEPVLQLLKDQGARVLSSVPIPCPTCGEIVTPNVVHLCGDRKPDQKPKKKAAKAGKKAGKKAAK